MDEVVTLESLPFPRVSLTVTQMANGGMALGRDDHGRPIFVPYAIPGERLTVDIVKEKGRYAEGRIVTVETPSAQRQTARCRHFGVCGGCHFQHITYEGQLVYKQSVLLDQLQRIGGIMDAPIEPIVPHPEPWQAQMELAMSPSESGALGLWSPSEQAVIGIQECHLLHPELQQLLIDINLAFPDLHILTMRLGDDESLLLALQTIDGEPPSLEVDFPLSVALVLADGTAVNLIGDNDVTRIIQEIPFRVSAGCPFPPHSGMAAQLVTHLLRLLALTGREHVWEIYSGVGWVSAFAAAQAASWVAIEPNPDAVADMAVNVADGDNVSLYQGEPDALFAQIPDPRPDVLLLHAPVGGIPLPLLDAIADQPPARLIYVCDDVALMARDSARLVRTGYRLQQIQPLDTFPQTFYTQTISLWRYQPGE